jgi:tripartite-type tricarboxylate transporter receptor subunit TctC
MEFSLWTAIFAPKGTPKDIVTKVNGAVVAVLADPKVRDLLAKQGVDIAPREKQTPEALAAIQRAEIKKWWPIIDAAGINPQ